MTTRTKVFMTPGLKTLTFPEAASSGVERRRDDENMPHGGLQSEGSPEKIYHRARCIFCLRDRFFAKISFLCLGQERKHDLLHAGDDLDLLRAAPLRMAETVEQDAALKCTPGLFIPAYRLNMAIRTHLPPLRTGGETPPTAPTSALHLRCWVLSMGGQYFCYAEGDQTGN